MLTAHIFCEKLQPATRWVDRHGPRPCVHRNSPRRILQCNECYRLRWAKNMVVACHYDMVRVSCREGHGWDGRRRRFITKIGGPS